MAEATPFCVRLPAGTRSRLEAELARRRGLIGRAPLHLGSLLVALVEERLDAIAGVLPPAPERHSPFPSARSAEGTDNG